MRPRRIQIAAGLAIVAFAQSSRAATVSGGFEGSNVVDIREIATNEFTCKLATPPMAVPASARYGSPGDHYHNWFILKIADAAGEAVTVTITNADWGGGGDGMWGRADGKAVYTEALDPNALSADTTWQKLTTSTYLSPNFSFTLTPSSDLAWVALFYPSLPTHTDNWVTQQATSPFVTAEIVATTARGRPVWMLFVTDSGFAMQGKAGVVLYGQEHMNEQTGGWACKGAVEFLTSGDSVAQNLLQNAVFVVIPDLDPDATASGLNCNPDDGKIPQWRYNPAAVERMMPGMLGPMTVSSNAIWNRLVQHVNDGGRIDFAFNIHQGGRDNFWGVYELVDTKSISLDSFLRTYMPTSGAPWVPNARQGYSRGGWQSMGPAGPFAMRLLGRCWEEWRTVPMGYEISLGANADNFITSPAGFEYFGEAIARAVDDYFGSFDSTITVTSPNGGESLSPGSGNIVAWSSSGAVGNVRIDFSADGGASWSTLVGATLDDGTQSVTLPTVASNSCFIRVSDVSAMGVADSSDAPFTVGAPPGDTIVVTAPNGGETWSANWIDSVTWASSAFVENVRIEVSSDNGVSWRRLTYAAPNNGSYVVNVPDTPSTDCLVRVTGVENPGVSDTSDATFTIGGSPTWPTLTVTAPNGGETWTPNGSATVGWSTTGVVDEIGIALSSDEGGSWTTLVATTPNDGSEVVAVPDVASPRCLVWVFDARNDPWLNRPDADPMDTSDAFFAIGTTPALAVGPTASPSQGSAPLAVQFDANITGGVPPYTIAWDFGDGVGTSTLAQPSYQYDWPATYTATVTVVDDNSDSVAGDIEVWVWSSGQDGGTGDSDVEGADPGVNPGDPGVNPGDPGGSGDDNGDSDVEGGDPGVGSGDDNGDSGPGDIGEGDAGVDPGDPSSGDGSGDTNVGDATDGNDADKGGVVMTGGCNCRLAADGRDGSLLLLTMLIFLPRWRRPRSAHHDVGRRGG
ncbi:PKD domain-containing protein [Myxococcota bacterium]